jgi:hypothetical protein
MAWASLIYRLSVRLSATKFDFQIKKTVEQQGRKAMGLFRQPGCLKNWVIRLFVLNERFYAGLADVHHQKKNRRSGCAEGVT